MCVFINIYLYITSFMITRSGMVVWFPLLPITLGLCKCQAKATECTRVRCFAMEIGLVAHMQKIKIDPFSL